MADGGWRRARCPRGHRLRLRRGGLLSGSQGRSGWSGGCRQGAQPLPAGQEHLLPGPGAADLQDAGAGGADQSGGQAQQPGSVSGSASLRSSQSYRPSSRHQAARSAARLAASTQPQCHKTPLLGAGFVPAFAHVTGIPRILAPQCREGACGHCAPRFRPGTPSCQGGRGRCVPLP